MSEHKRPYQKVAHDLRQMIISRNYTTGSRLPPERELAEILDVSRMVVREALIMLELENLIEVRQGSGIYITEQLANKTENHAESVSSAGPFELLQARQLLESNIAEFAATQATPIDISNMRHALEHQRNELASGEGDSGDKEFHLAIAEATHNSMVIELLKQSWSWRDNNPMWIKLHTHVTSTTYRQEWIKDHEAILAAMVKKDPVAAKQAMWQHLENVKQRLLELSDLDDPYFDGYLFDSYPVCFVESYNS